MNDQPRTNGRMSLAITGGIGITGALLGAIVTLLLTKSAPKAPAPIQWYGVITLNSDGSCSQSASQQDPESHPESLVTYAFPVLSKGRKDQIMWDGQVGSGPVGTSVHVEFPSGTGNPFFNKNKFDKKDPSGRVRDTAGYGDYPFADGTVTVNGQACTSLKDPGVHVDN